jgi:hypothetical protein
MSNQQTAAEWEQAATRAAAELESNSAKIYTAEGRISQIQSQQREIMQKRNALSREGVGMNDPRAAALRAEYFKLDDQVVQQSAFKGQLLEHETLLQITLDNATTQAAQASTGAPNTSSNTPPATDRPNTDPATVAPANAVPPTDIVTPAATSTSPPISISTPDGTFLFNSQAEYDAWAANPGDYAQSFVGNGYVVNKITLPQTNAAVDEAIRTAGIQENIAIAQVYISDAQTQIADEFLPDNLRQQYEDNLINNQEVVAVNQALLQQQDQPVTVVNQAPVQQEQNQQPTAEQIAASDLEVYPNAVAAEEDAGLYDQQQAILAAQAEQKQQDLYGSYGGASEAESNALTQALTENARFQQTMASQRKTQNNGDWRVRLRLAPRADYLYLADPPGEILAPLAGSDGVIFPYTPQISTSYRANYSTADLTHSNYRGYFYQNSYVDAVTLRCPFTAQSTAEANYLLAVIHFFRSVTKMFYGRDPQRGAPPPLVYLSGLGQYQFNENPCVVSAFDYTLPSDVDYIRAGSSNMNQTNMQNLRPRQTGGTSSVGAFGALLGGALDRLAAAGVNKGAVNSTPPTPNFGLGNPTYVPTKMEISITLFPVQSRAQVSQQFSVRDFANGKLLKSGGFW